MLTSEKKVKNTEKETIKSMSKGIGLTLLGYFAIMIGWSFIYVKIAAQFGWGVNTSLKFVNEPMGENIIQLLVSLGMNLIPALVFCRVQKQKVKNVISFKKPEGRVFNIIIAALGFCYFSSMATDLAGSLFEDAGLSAPSVEIQNPDGIFGFFMSVIVVSIIPALLEEFAMRGIVMGILRRFGDGFAIICSAVAFGLMHASAQQIPFATLVGLVLGFIAVKTNSIWPAVAVHAANNLLSVLLSYASDYFAENTYVLIDFAVSIIVLIGFIIGVYNISKKDDGFFKLSFSDTKLSEKEKLLTFFTTPMFVISAVLSVVIAFLLR